MCGGCGGAVSDCVWVCRSTGEFEAKLDIPQGKHEYKYLVDGAWQHDHSQVVCVCV